MMPELYDFDYGYLSGRAVHIAGVDEVGRGALAGPVLASAVILEYTKVIAGVNDSKKLSPKHREALYHEITRSAVSIATVQVDHKTIDDINIVNASKLAMGMAVRKLKVCPDLVLVDALGLDLDIPSISIIKGDQKSAAIACASIIAKVRRDVLMCWYHQRYPQYAFDRHKGYPTAAHLSALGRYGVSEIHRRSYAPVKRCLRVFC